MSADQATQAAVAAAPLALVVHDLKNALGALEGQLQALTLQPSRESAHLAHARCVELRQRFVHYLTVYGSDQALQAQCEDESPLELLTQMARRTEHHLPGHVGAVHVAIEASDDTPTFAYFDARLVRMALEAAMHNALRFASSHVWLKCHTQDGSLMFSVRDDGPGLDAPDTSEASTGLGTTLCQAVAWAHEHAGKNGVVKLYNHPAGGACFELHLP